MKMNEQLTLSKYLYCVDEVALTVFTLPDETCSWVTFIVEQEDIKITKIIKLNLFFEKNILTPIKLS